MTENRHIKRSMARERVRAAVWRSVSPARWLMVLVALLALAIQSFAVQAHIHRPHTALGIQAAPLADANTASILPANRTAPTPADKLPAGGDPANCPLCQGFAHSGQFVQSAASLAALPAYVTVHFIVFRQFLPSYFAVSHSWQVRAPPQT